MKTLNSLKSKMNSNDDLIEIFEDIKGMLNAYNLCSVAFSAGVAVSTVYNWHNGKTKAPRISTFIKVARALGYEVKLIHGDTPRHLKLVK